MGSGGTCTVYLGEHVLLRSYRAIKQIDKKNPLYEGLIKEASILKSLKHPNIPIIYDIEEDEQYAYIIEEYLEGESLKSYMSRLENRNRKTVLDFSMQLCDLFSYLHEGEDPVIYLDLKPENLLVRQGMLKLFDFGAAVHLKERGKYGRYSWGTYGYAAPEQYEGLICTDTRSDIYGFGMLFFYMMTGESYGMAGEERVLEEIRNPIWGKGYGRILKKCLKQNPEERFQSMSEIHRELRRLSGKQDSHPVWGRCNEKKKAFVIAIAGSQQRIGTTHAGILITNQLVKSGIKCAYIEKNENHVVESLNSFAKSREDGVCIYHGCTFVANHSWQIDQLQRDESYQAFVVDFGVLDQEKEEAFYQVDYPCLVVGCKPWEENGWMEMEHVCFLLNFISEEDKERMGKRIRCLRLPYQPNPFVWGKNNKIAEEMEELVESILRRTIKKKAFLPWKR